MEQPNIGPIELAIPPAILDNWLVPTAGWPTSRIPSRAAEIKAIYDECREETWRRIRENRTGDFQYTLESTMLYIEEQFKRAKKVADRAGPPLTTPPQPRPPPQQS